MKEAKLIVIKEYKEFVDEVQIDGITEGQVLNQEMLIAKEIEAVVRTENDAEFSIGFSVTRNNPMFDLENPREIVREFLLQTFINDASQA